MLPAGTRCPASAAASSNSPPARSKPCMTESSQVPEQPAKHANERPGLFSRLLEGRAAQVERDVGEAGRLGREFLDGPAAFLGDAVDDRERLEQGDAAARHVT